MTRPKYWWQLTSAGDLFKDTYWGAFQINNENPDPLIITNRNNFADHYELVKARSSQAAHDFVSLILNTYDGDHPECYRTKSKEYVVLFSDYNSVDPRLGWVVRVVPPLYLKKCTSYLFHFHSLQCMRTMGKQLGDQPVKENDDGK